MFYARLVFPYINNSYSNPVRELGFYLHYTNKKMHARGGADGPMVETLVDQM